MPNLKDQILKDLGILFNTNEFADIHNINGRDMPVIIDNDRLSQRTKKEYEGIYVGDLLFYVQSDIYGNRPKPESVIIFDQKPCSIFDVREDNGLYEIILKASES